MTANGNDLPQDPAVHAERTREEAVKTTEAVAGKADDMKERAKVKAAQTKDAVAGQTDQAVRAAQDKATQAKDKVTDLASRARETDVSAAAANPAVRAGAVATGVAAVLVAWLLRRRARRNANPWLVAARTAKSQIKTTRRQAKSGLKTARKRSRAEAAAQIASAKVKARKARDKAKSWG
jgi:hypothetical protein